MTKFKKRGFLPKLLKKIRKKQNLDIDKIADRAMEKYKDVFKRLAKT